MATAPALDTSDARNGIVIHRDLDQGSLAWLKARCGLLTASEMKLILTVGGGEVVTNYRETGVLPDKLTPTRANALNAIGDRRASVRDLAFLADVSDGVIRALIKDGALEAIDTIAPRVFKFNRDDKERSHLYELLAQRITNHVEPHYFSDDMLRGQEDEIEARIRYAKEYAPVEEVGFITNDKWGFTLGYSPDGLVGNDGLIECKSRRQKFQIQTIVEAVAEDTIMPEYMLQCQTGMLVAERQWVDLVSYSGGLPMATVRVWPDPTIQEAILNAAADFEARIAAKMEAYFAAVASSARLVPTERRVEQEIF